MYLNKQTLQYKLASGESFFIRYTKEASSHMTRGVCLTQSAPTIEKPQATFVYIDDETTIDDIIKIIILESMRAKSTIVISCLRYIPEYKPIINYQTLVKEFEIKINADDDIYFTQPVNSCTRESATELFKKKYRAVHNVINSVYAYHRPQINVLLGIREVIAIPPFMFYAIPEKKDYISYMIDYIDKNMSRIMLTNAFSFIINYKDTRKWDRGTLLEVFHLCKDHVLSPELKQMMNCFIFDKHFVKTVVAEYSRQGITSDQSALYKKMVVGILDKLFDEYPFLTVISRHLDFSLSTEKMSGHKEKQETIQAIIKMFNGNFVFNKKKGGNTNAE